jgi:hypothetical protein
MEDGYHEHMCLPWYSVCRLLRSHKQFVGFNNHFNSAGHDSTGFDGMFKFIAISYLY